MSDTKAHAKARNDYEHQQQKALMEWVHMARGKYPELALLYAIPNGGHRSKATAGRLKAEGVKAGVPDLHLPIARGGFIGLWIEMKSPTGKPSDSQKAWAKRLTEEGHKVELCRSAQEALNVIVWYLNQGKQK